MHSGVSIPLPLSHLSLCIVKCSPTIISVLFQRRKPSELFQGIKKGILDACFDTSRNRNALILSKWAALFPNAVIMEGTPHFATALSDVKMALGKLDVVFQTMLNELALLHLPLTVVRWFNTETTKARIKECFTESLLDMQLSDTFFGHHHAFGRHFFQWFHFLSFAFQIFLTHRCIILGSSGLVLWCVAFALHCCCRLCDAVSVWSVFHERKTMTACLHQTNTQTNSHASFQNWPTCSLPPTAFDTNNSPSKKVH